MRTKIGTPRRLTLAVALLGLGACGGDIVRAESARVVVDASPEEPLELLISRDFVMVFNDAGQQSPAFLSMDTVFLSGSYDQTFDLPGEEPRIYVRLANLTLTPEQVRLRIWLDDGLEYDASANMVSPGYLSYVYSTDSQGSNGF